MERKGSKICGLRLLSGAKRKGKWVSSGVAALEAAGLSIVLLFLIVAGIGLVDYLQKVMLLSHLVDKHLFDQSIKPLVLTAEGGLSVAEGRVRTKLPELLQGLKADLEEALPHGAFSVERVLLESDFAVVGIDPQSGAGRGLLLYPGSSFSWGALNVPAEQMAESDLRRQFADLAALAFVPSPLAAPTGLLAGEEAARYIDKTMVVGIRAFYSLEGTFGGKLAQLLGLGRQPVIFDHKVITLRGEAG